MKTGSFHLNAPAAIAFSGGGDSSAMLHAYRNDPSVQFAFIVDHALRDGSTEEAEQAAEIAKSYGYQVKIDRWAHDGITSAIQSKARAYRYAALGRLCRGVGITRLMTAHTADDQAETLLMRLDRQTGWRGLAGMPDAAYAPIWPELAGIVLHRPWLSKSRAELRDYNRQHTVPFIDDPSNENRKFTRIRARQALAADPEMRADLLSQQKRMRARLTEERQTHGAWLSKHARLAPQGFMETDAIPAPELLAHILNIVAGRGGQIDAASCARLCREMESRDFKASTLGGAWVVRKMNPMTKMDSLTTPTVNSPNNCEAHRHSFVFLRDKVAVTGRSNVPPIESAVLELDVPTIWDGRFLCQAKRNGVRIEPAFGHLQKLRQFAEFKEIFDLPKAVRGSLPIYFHEGDPIGFGTCDSEFITSTATSASRLQAMFGEACPVPI